jgi:DNA-binding NtrC family response regulator
MWSKMPTGQPKRKCPKLILIVSQNQLEAIELSAMMVERNYASDILLSLEELASRLGSNDVTAVFIDVDSVSVDNRYIRDLTLKHPSVYFFCISRDRFHPELKDAICYHIYACLNKPVDPDELRFFLDSIAADLAPSG